MTLLMLVLHRACLDAEHTASTMQVLSSSYNNSSHSVVSQHIISNNLHSVISQHIISTLSDAVSVRPGGI